MAEADLFSRFGGVRPMARELGIEHPSKVQNWKNARRIPSGWQQRILEAGRRLNLGLLGEDVIFPFPEDRVAR